MSSGKIFQKLMHIAANEEVTVKFAPLQGYNGRLKGNQILIKQEFSNMEDVNYNLAHELAHYFLHYDKDDTINSEKHEEYEEQADRAAQMLLVVLAT